MVVVIPSSAETQVLAERLVALSGDWRVGRVREEGAEGASGLGPALHIEDVDGLCHERVVLLASLETPALVVCTLSVAFALAKVLRSPGGALTLAVPFYATGPSKLIRHEGQVSTSACVARLLSAVPPCAGGPTQVLLLDVHDLDLRMWFRQDSVAPLTASVLDALLRPRLAQLLCRAQTAALAPAGSEQAQAARPSVAAAAAPSVVAVVCFPDAGAEQRFGHVVRRWGVPVLVCDKRHRHDGGGHDGLEAAAACVRPLGSDALAALLQPPDGAVAGEGVTWHVVVVDDIVRTGRTLLAAREAVLALAATLRPRPVRVRTWAFAVHCCLHQGNSSPGGSGEATPRQACAALGAAFERVWVTDTCCRGVALVDPGSHGGSSGCVEVLSCAPALWEALQGLLAT